MFKFLPLISVKDITSAIFEAIVTPIAGAVSNVVSTALGFVINDVLSPMLKALFNSIVEPILGLIGDVLLAWLHVRTYYLYVAVLRIIDILEYAFNVFGGISKVNVIDGKSTSSDFLLNIFFSNSGVSYVFWGITLLAFGVSLIFGIIAVIRSSADLDGKRPVGKVLGAIAKTGLTFLIVPFFMTFALNMTNVVIRKTNEILSMSMGEETPSLGTVLFLATTLQAEENSAGILTNSQLAEKIKEENNNEMAGFTDGVRAKYYSGERNYWDFAQVSSDFNIAQVQTVLGLFMSVFIALMLIICTFVFITRLFEVMLLYIASPFFVATIPLDDGAKFEEWKNMFIAKLFSGFGMLIGMKLYILLVPIIMSSNLELSSVNFVNMGLKILFILGGAFAIYKSNSLLMQILNVQASHGESAAAQTVFGGIMSINKKAMKSLGLGMRITKSIVTPEPGKPQNLVLQGNTNPNLNSFNRVGVSPGVTRNGRITIGSHRANKPTDNKIEIGSHRRNKDNGVKIGAHRAQTNSDTKWKSAKPSSETRNGNVTIGSYAGGRTNWKNAEKSNETRTSDVTIGSYAGGRTNWKNAEAPSGERKKDVNIGEQRSEPKSSTNTWKMGVVNKPSQAPETKTTLKNTTSTETKTTWKKATPKNKND